jgi:peptidoglycan/LPS O-acetylase OafA/YrhL
MFISLPFAWLWLIPTDMKDFSQSLAAVSSFSSNILFWRETGYWGAANELKPLLHTWSLAVEEQYYILFPLFLMLMWRFRKRWILSSFIVIAAISLVTSEWGAYNHPTANFFLLPTRGWELAIGACIAFYFLYRKQTIRVILRNRSVDEVLGLIGLLMIGYAVFVFDEATPFPSFYALIPTVGAGLIILFSSTETLVGRLLSTKLLVGIGLISYSAYLWHQPLLAFSRHASLTEPNELTLATLASLSFPLAYLTWRFIEQPFRNKRRYRRKVIYIFSVTGSLFFLVVGLIGHYTGGFQSRFKLDQSVLDGFIGNKIRADCDINSDVKNGQIDFCTLGAKTIADKVEFAVFGDSHSAAILPAFEIVAHSSNLKYSHIGLGGCIPFLGVDVVNGNFTKGICENLALKQFEYVKNNSIKKVFLVARWSLYTDGEYDKDMKRYFLVDKNNKEISKKNSRMVFLSGLIRTVNEYRNIGADIYIVEQVPQQKIDPEKMYYNIAKFNFSTNKIKQSIATLSISRTSSNGFQAYNRKVFRMLENEEKIEIVNVDNYFCTEEVCLVGDIDRSYYRDNDHISIDGAKMISKELRLYLE